MQNHDALKQTNKQTTKFNILLFKRYRRKINSSFQKILKNSKKKKEKKLIILKQQNSFLHLRGNNSFQITFF
jgi:uncharacterized protein (DUF927 family)